MLLAASKHPDQRRRITFFLDASVGMSRRKEFAIPKTLLRRNSLSSWDMCSSNKFAVLFSRVSGISILSIKIALVSTSCSKVGNSSSESLQAQKYAYNIFESGNYT